MKLWVDDVIPAPEGYIWVCSVNEAKRYIEFCEHFSKNINGSFLVINPRLYAGVIKKLKA